MRATPRTSTSRESGRMDAGVPIAIMIVLALLAAPEIAARAGWTLPTWAKVVGVIGGLAAIGLALTWGSGGGFGAELTDAERQELDRRYGDPGTPSDPPG